VKINLYHVTWLTSSLCLFCITADLNKIIASLISLACYLFLKSYFLTVYLRDQIVDQYSIMKCSFPYTLSNLLNINKQSSLSKAWCFPSITSSIIFDPSMGLPHRKHETIQINPSSKMLHASQSAYSRRWFGFS
jgi:hypothetical protein